MEGTGYLIRLNGGTDAQVLSAPLTNTKNIISEFLQSQGVKPASRETYRKCLKPYFEWIENKGKYIAELTHKDIVAYTDYLKEERKLSALTVRSYIVAVRMFYVWTESERIYPNIAAGKLDLPKRSASFKRNHLTEEQSRELVEYYKGKSLRDFAIVNLILRTGLRTIEVTRLNIEDITMRGGTRILKVWGKGKDDKEDFVILSEKAYEPIRDYLQTRKGARAAEPLFSPFENVNPNTTDRLSTRTIRRICREGLDAIGLDGREFCAHALRHTTACLLLKKGASVDDVQGVLRHTSPVTTQIYLESIKEENRLAKAPERLLDDAF